MLSPLVSAHRARLSELVDATPEFSADEKSVAMELADAALAGADDYRFLLDFEGERLRGYICFGPTPMTRGTWDLYWIAVSSAFRGHGVGRGLVAAMEEHITRERARLVRVETESSPAYEATRAFYDSIGYARLAVVRDFYDVGNDLVLYGRYFSPPPPTT